ncbi:hypothetical protein C6P46_005856 [Rhodotorula mucilaginosa]|uniref:Uncharacterized protein n=1 Tax=Rhodotorula mucilaginosa TaxID=5537 RepID=A0A9P6VZU1_RHOMI|nr:hypothetical protein C6P46_005856 [Rhodotorula mucilaginosa]
MRPAVAEETEAKPCPLPAAEQPGMYRVWYKILIKKVCRIAKGTTSQRSQREKTKHGNPSRLGLMDKCLDAWADHLIKALSAPLPEKTKWTLAQYEAVYHELWQAKPENILFCTQLLITPKHLWDTLNLPYDKSILSQQTDTPALPYPFPKHSKQTGVPLSDRTTKAVYLNPEEMTLWIFGDDCPSGIERSLKRWQASFCAELESSEVYKKLPATSTGRLALTYCLEVLLLNSLKDEILSRGQQDTANGLCIGIVQTLFTNDQGTDKGRKRHTSHEPQPLQDSKKRFRPKACTPHGRLPVAASRFTPHGSLSPAQRSLGVQPLFAGQIAQKYYGIHPQYSMYLL